ncbi:Hypothetical protein FKW44_007086 [Caligus rogercresseyi]|uniref:Uncharacterized protein n=1 Tax=Caligus rogercresseyi TaxID=217165 RepID=A0A7T8KE91_CALRO|nr:Hypothetical protein FKW44_007086 [Caligus rogercresseyi]
MAYCCNLRAVIIAKEYSKPIDKGPDILEQKRPVYLFGNALPTTLLKTSEFEVHKKILGQFTGTYHYLNSEGNWKMKCMRK